MKRETPSDSEIEQLIAPAIERLPVPDARRLAAIERQLLEQPEQRRRSKTTWWWLVGALVAGAASALWWAVDYDSEKGLEEPSPGIAAPKPAPAPEEQPARPGSAEPAPANPVHKTGPRIYQREQ